MPDLTQTHDAIQLCLPYIPPPPWRVRLTCEDINVESSLAFDDESAARKYMDGTGLGYLESLKPWLRCGAVEKWESGRYIPVSIWIVRSNGWSQLWTT